MPQLTHISIRNRILLITLLTFLTIALFVASALFYEIRTQKKDLIDRTQALAQFIGQDAASDLQSGNKEPLQRRLKQVMGHLGIEAVYIFDANGDLFLADPNTFSLSNPYGWMAPRIEFSDDALHLVEPILLKNQVQGSIYLRVSTQALTYRIKKYSILLISYMIIVLAVSILLVLRLHKTISEPINQLVRTMREVPESVAFNVEPIKTEGDEIVDLYSGFNKLLRKLDRRGMQRDLAEKALRESERKYRILVESSPDAIFIEQKDRLIYMNPSGLKLLGFGSEVDILGKDIYSFLSLPKPFPSPTFETKFIRPDTGIMDIDVTLIQITHREEPAIQGIVRDITERKHLREVSERMKRLAAIGELSAHIAHEIRNSIGSLQLNLRNLSDHILTAELRNKVLANMQTGIQRMEETVTAILNFAKPTQPSMKTVPVRMVLESALKATEKELAESNIQVVRDYDDACPDVFLDPNQIHLVLINLVRNSREAMSSGGTMFVKTRLAEAFVEIALTDTGEGIAATNIDRIFDPFFTTKHHGTGLGLAFVARTLEQHGASIFVESSQNAGTKFYIRFPLNQSDHS